jgi:hypothetical protein
MAVYGTWIWYTGPTHIVMANALCWVQGYTRQVDIKQYQTHLQPHEAKAMRNTAHKARQKDRRLNNTALCAYPLLAVICLFLRHS